MDKTRHDGWDPETAYAQPTAGAAHAHAITPLQTQFSDVAYDRPGFVRRVALAIAFEPPRGLSRRYRRKPVGP